MLPRARMLIVIGALLLPLASAAAAHAATVSFDSSTGQLSVLDGASGGNDVTIRLVGSTLEVTETAAIPAAGSGCDNTDGDATVTCTVGPATPYVDAFFGNGNDRVELIGVRGGQVNGGAGDDHLLGSDLADVLQGDAGDDTLEGRGGRDLLYGDGDDDTIDGGAGDDAIEGGDGGDVMHDTGGGGDVVSYRLQITDAAGVEVTLDGAANDGNVNQDAGGTDNVGAGIDSVQGSGFSDELAGGPGGEFLSGAGGDDTLIGNGGADSFNGADGNDRIEARDGVVDADIDCDNSMGSHGSADVAVLDANDPAPRNCETVERPAATGTTPADPGTTPGGGVSPFPTGSAILGVEDTRESQKMPDVAGRSMDAARRAVLARVASIDLDVVFQRGCAASKDQEVVRQRPAKGTRLDSYEGSDLPVRLYVCIAERDFLADCDLKDLRSDLKALPRRLDADLGLAVIERFRRCKVDYDVKLSGKAEEARTSLEAQKAAKKGAKAQIRTAIECPTSPEDQDLTMTLTEGSVVTRGRFGLHENGPRGWTIPAHGGGEFTSYVDVLVRDKSLPAHSVEATIYIDGEAAGITPSDTSFPRQSAQRVIARKGYARLLLSPRKAGPIRLCAVYRTGDDQVLTAVTQIEVVGPLKVGDRWTTISGRQLEITKDGPVETTQAARARAAGLDQIWDFVVSLFGGASRSVSAAAAEGTTRAQKLRSIQSLWAAAQVSLDGTLDADPQPPTVARGACLGFQAGGKVLEMTCPRLTTTGNSALLAMSTNGAGIVAAGAGNIIGNNGNTIVAAGAGNVLSHNGGAIVAAGGLNGKGATIVAAGGGNVLGPAGAQLVGPDGASLIGPDGASLIGPDGATLVAAGGGNIVAAGGLN